MPLLVIISATSWAIPFLAGVLAFKRLGPETRILVSYFALLGLVDVFGVYLALNKINNIWLFHLFTPLEYGFLVMVFSYWQRRSLLRLLLRVSIPLFVLICIVSKLFVEDLVSFDSFTSSLESWALILISIYTLLALHRDKSSPILGMPRFWIAAAVLIYFSGNIPIFAFANIAAVWPINHVLNIISNMLFAGGFLCCHLNYRVYGV